MAADDTRGLQTLLIGLDAGSMSLLGPMLSDDELPAIRTVFSDGVSGDLRSQIPPWTPSAWPTVYTGTNPGKHGVFGFLAFDGYEWDLVDANSVDEWSIWELCDRHGLTSVVVNAPVTYPPPEIDGAIVPGYLAPEDPRCHPAGILSDIRREIGDYRIYPPKDEDEIDGELVTEMETLVEMRGEAFRYLADRFEPDFGFVQFQQTDTILHQYPGDMDRLRTIYRAVDRQVDAIIEQCRPETVILVSDHGMDAYTYQFRINEHLRSEGYVQDVKGGTGMPSWASIRENQLRDGADATTLQPRLIDRMLALAAKVGITSQRIGTLLERVHLLEFVERQVSSDAVRAASEQVDFPNSRAYMRARPECGIRINLEGREPEGVVPQSAYESEREALISELSTVTTPDGDPVFEDVAPRERYFHGPHVEKAPDIVTVPRDFDVYLSTWLLPETFEKPDSPSWDHTLSGIIAASGAGIDPAESVPEGANIQDVAPTVLGTLGISPNERMDGTTLPFVANLDSNPYPEYQRGETAPGEQHDLSDRLSSLGYLE